MEKRILKKKGAPLGKVSIKTSRDPLFLSHINFLKTYIYHQKSDMQKVIFKNLCSYNIYVKRAKKLNLKRK